MPASTGSHCSRWVSQRGEMLENWGGVLVALASCRAALSPRAGCGWMESDMAFPLLEDGFKLGVALSRQSRGADRGFGASRWGDPGRVRVDACSGRLFKRNVKSTWMPWQAPVRNADAPAIAAAFRRHHVSILLPLNVGSVIQYFFYRSGLGYHAAGRRAPREPDVPADDGALADGDAPQHGGPGVDHHVILDDGMPADAFPKGTVFGLGEAFRAQRDGLVQSHPIA